MFFISCLSLSQRCLKHLNVDTEHTLLEMSDGATFCNTTNEGGGVTSPSDFQIEPTYDAYFGTNG